ncbi:MAG: cobalamin-dependent protein [Chloroflexales bacterium]|nr:cobalamin-dependent protein [Chloroflexales bacterium]
MTTSSPSVNQSVNTGPSLFKLVHAVPEDYRLRLPADALVIIGRQLEIVVQNHQLAADVAIGTLRFSLFRLHQGRIAQLANCCRSVTVYGEKDINPPDIPGVEFVALDPDSPLCNEWFLVVDSPVFWGALLTQAVPERQNGNLRRYLFEGALTPDESIISRACLLLSLARRRPALDLGSRDLIANRIYWASVAYELAMHIEAERLTLTSCLGKFPELLEILQYRTTDLESLLSLALTVLHHHAGTTAELFYRYEDQQLQPLVWRDNLQPAPLSLQNSIAGRALQQRTPILIQLTPQNPEQALLPGAHSLTAAPLLLNGEPWGVLMTGQYEDDPTDSHAALSTISVAALLERILPDKVVSTEDQRPSIDIKVPAPNQAPIDVPAVSFDNPATPTQPSDEPLIVSSPLEQTMSPVPEPIAPSPLDSASIPSQAAQPEIKTPNPPEQSGELPALAAVFGLPTWMFGAGTAPAKAAQPAPPPPAPPDRSMVMLQRRLMGALIAFDRPSAEAVWNEACSLYIPETVCTELLMPVQVAIGEGWHRGEVSVAAEHFSSRFVQTKLLTMLNAQTDVPSALLAVIGCAQSEMHELGAIMLSLFMRWAGFRVIYLGQNVPNTTLADLIRQLRPQVLGLSASMVESAHNLIEVGQLIMRIEPPRPLFIYGGMAFYERPDLRGRIMGQFLGGDVRKMVRQLAEQLRAQK